MLQQQQGTYTFGLILFISKKSNRLCGPIQGTEGSRPSWKPHSGRRPHKRHSSGPRWWQPIEIYAPWQWCWPYGNITQATVIIKTFLVVSLKWLKARETYFNNILYSTQYVQHIIISTIINIKYFTESFSFFWYWVLESSVCFTFIGHLSLDQIHRVLIWSWTQSAQF